MWLFYLTKRQDFHLVIPAAQGYRAAIDEAGEDFVGLVRRLCPDGIGHRAADHCGDPELARQGLEPA